jgi:predicted CopG family antitoxin
MNCEGPEIPFAMSKNDQKEFLDLHNSFLDLDSFSDEKKKYYFDLKNEAENQPYFESDLFLKIICISQTNGFGVGKICIKVSRINHSCGPNSQHFTNDEGEMEIRATSKILEGQEITISYIDAMKNFKERRECCHKFGFVCSCELCQEEEIKNDDEIYQKFQNLKDEAEKSYSNFLEVSTFKKKSDHIEKALGCQNKMYSVSAEKT